MELITHNVNQELVNIIQTKAMYQKVLLIYDNTVSNFDINLTHSRIKELCIFNKMSINQINKQELYNGYKLLIYLCSGESILKLDFNREDFINVYIPTTNIILPFYLNHYHLLSNNCYLLLHNNHFDINILNSLSFNNFYNYLENLINGKVANCNFFSFNGEINNYTLFNSLQNLNQELNFIDIHILTQVNLDYKDLPILNLILIDALLILITSVKNSQLTLVDAYKLAKEDSSLIDKIYHYVNNNYFSDIIKLNFENLIRIATLAKENLLKCLPSEINSNKTNEIIIKIKNYIKNCNHLLFYLYVFNIF